VNADGERAARLTVSEDKMSGQVCIDGYRFPISILWAYLSREYGPHDAKHDRGATDLKRDYLGYDYINDDTIAVAAALLRDAKRFLKALEDDDG
jgi:hypothetical protein